MTWTKLSDDFSDEAWTLSDAAFRLQVEGLNYSNRKLLNLRLPKSELRRFAKTPEAAAELVKGGWWTDDGDSYVIVFHGAHQPSRDEVIKRQERNKANGQKGGRPPKPVRERAPETQSVTQVGSEMETQSLTQVETHRDGTGRAITDEVVERETGQSGEVVDGWVKTEDGWVEVDEPKPSRLSWPVVAIPGSEQKSA